MRHGSACCDPSGRHPRPLRHPMASRTCGTCSGSRPALLAGWRQGGWGGRAATAHALPQGTALWQRPDPPRRPVVLATAGRACLESLCSCMGSCRGQRKARQCWPLARGGVLRGRARSGGGGRCGARCGAHGGGASIDHELAGGLARPCNRFDDIACQLGTGGRPIGSRGRRATRVGSAPWARPLVNRTAPECRRRVVYVKRSHSSLGWRVGVGR